MKLSDPLSAAIKVASSALSAQAMRMQVVAENLANAHSTAAQPGGDPYTRKTVSFEAALVEASGGIGVRLDAIGRDSAPYRAEFNASHPAADAHGYVKHPNVNPLIELGDMREANRSYEANLQVIRQSRELVAMTIDLLKAT